jgi:hypothetical protein
MCLDHLFPSHLVEADLYWPGRGKHHTFGHSSVLDLLLLGLGLQKPN